MININLLPYREILRKENIINHAVIAGGTLFLVLLLVVIMHSIISGNINDVNEDIVGIEKEIASNKVSMKEINKLKKEKETYRKQFQIIENLRKGKEGPVLILDGLASNIPDKIWLLSLKQTGNSLELTGVSVDNKLISKFMNILEKSPYFKNVDLISSEMKSHVTGKKRERLNKFTITCFVESSSQT
ncbi:MAG: PilN domain-containing protein [Deltaproteobacteria bacterium]|jgi:type IV pilus assembly protein PilN|nr:PilN domain-containing protein [Deltaproteobacteria bacterium]MBW2652100.1 PilN domain-containing protein [Deltaproteobacteria bacterium]